MVTYLKTDIFASPAQTLVNTVNTVGIMGKGIAKQFKEHYPDMFSEYRRICDAKGLSVGNLHLWRGGSNWVLNFPTKTTWRQPSKIDYVESGLKKFVSTYHDLGVTSASFPPLGCGNGNLDWDVVRPMMAHFLSKCNIPIFIHDIQVADSFVPEHQVGQLPADFNAFWRDLLDQVSSRTDPYITFKGSRFNVHPDDEYGLRVVRDGKRVGRISEEMLTNAYTRLRHSLLSGDSFSGETEMKIKNYLMPILAELSYVRASDARRDGASNATRLALFVPRVNQQAGLDILEDSQGCLFH